MKHLLIVSGLVLARNVIERPAQRTALQIAEALTETRLTFMSPLYHPGSIQRAWVTSAGFRKDSAPRSDFAEAHQRLREGCVQLRTEGAGTFGLHFLFEQPFAIEVFLHVQKRISGCVRTIPLPAFNKRWPKALPGVGNRLRGHSIHGHYVACIDGHNRDIQCR